MILLEPYMDWQISQTKLYEVDVGVAVVNAFLLISKFRSECSWKNHSFGDELIKTNIYSL
jgi:hypothetical protein